jgi:hypothetical protein
VKNAAEYYAEVERDLYIETASGKNFYIARPEFDIDDIAEALSKQCRFTGHTSSFYSVAEHCVLVMDLMAELNQGDPFEGLMHDASEAYLSDIAAPWKVLLPDYKKLELSIEKPLRATYGLPETITPECKFADWLALFIEADRLIPSRARDWVAPSGVKETADMLLAKKRGRIMALNPDNARNMFLTAFWSHSPNADA